MNNTKLTPLMQQYWTIKNNHQDKIVLFRMGDFYEMFYDDAVVASKILGVALTSRNKSNGNDTPMCGIPHHALGNYIQKITDAGYKAAIVEQMEDPALAKTIVKRDVARIVTPGMVYDAQNLDASKAHYLAAVRKTDELFDIALTDISTGELRVFPKRSWIDTLEILLKNEIAEFLHTSGVNLELMTAVKTERECTQKSVEDYLIAYVSETQGEKALSTLQAPIVENQKHLRLSPQTLTGLEIFKTSDGRPQGSLFHLVNKTKTPMGSRLLRARLCEPFATVEAITKEQAKVASFVEDRSKASEFRRSLGEIGDFERRIGRLSSTLCNARDLRALALSTEASLKILAERHSERGEASPTAQELNDLASTILKTLKDELPHSVKEGNFINKGINAQLDEYIELATNAQTTLTELENKEREISGIQSLKVKYNNVFGYFFEVTKTNLAKVPSHFVRKQTLAQAERFVTEELTQLEAKILSSKQKRCDLEFEIFSDLKAKALKQASSLQKLCSFIAKIDVQLSWAEIAFQNQYCRPQFQENDIVLKGSRHPVIESFSLDPFIPNDIQINKGQCILLTGPNMAGKSTIMRQVALTIILAQCGAYVPATEARIPIFDAIHTRIGASDNLSMGLSTFMVEMTEAAQILSTANERSLILLDEIGRGTSTFDGMSLAQAILEYVMDHLKAYTLFATHYHELTSLSQDRPHVLNFHMSIDQGKTGLVFLRKLVPGPAKGSYGIEVAKLAGIPREVLNRASELLKGFAKSSQQISTKQMDLLSYDATQTLFDSQKKLDERIERFEALREKLHALRLETMTPLEAMNVLHKLHLQVTESSQREI